MPTQIYTIKQAAAFLGEHPDTSRERLRNGELKVTLFGPAPRGDSPKKSLSTSSRSTPGRSTPGVYRPEPSLTTYKVVS